MICSGSPARRRRANDMSHRFRLVDRARDPLATSEPATSATSAPAGPTSRSYRRRFTFNDTALQRPAPDTIHQVLTRPSPEDLQRREHGQEWIAENQRMTVDLGRPVLPRHTVTMPPGMTSADRRPSTKSGFWAGTLTRRRFCRLPASAVTSIKRSWYLHLAGQGGGTARAMVSASGRPSGRSAPIAAAQRDDPAQ